MSKSGSHSSKGFFRTKRGRFALFYLAPALLMYGFFVLWPLVNAFRLSMFRFTGLSQKTEFIGFANFQKLAASEKFFQSLQNNIWLLVFSLGIIIVVALLIAHATQDDTKFGKFLRAVYLFPHVISLVIVAMLWKFIFDPSLGFIQPTLQARGIPLPGVDYTLGILGSSSSALAAVGLSFIWYALGFYVMVLAAGIRSIPEDVKEAAALDGSSGLSKFFRVTWPLIWSVRRIVVIHLVIAVMNTFALVRLMTSGGPDGATEVTLSYLYKRGFSPDSFYGEATAIGVVNFLVAMLLTIVVIVFFGKDPIENSRSWLAKVMGFFSKMLGLLVDPIWHVISAVLNPIYRLCHKIGAYARSPFSKSSSNTEGGEEKQTFGSLLLGLPKLVLKLIGGFFKILRLTLSLLPKPIRYAALGFYIVVVIFPIAWMALSSFKTTNEIYHDPWSMPKEFAQRQDDLRSASVELQGQIDALPASFPTSAVDAREVASMFTAMAQEPVVDSEVEDAIVLIEPGGPIGRIRLYSPELRIASDARKSIVMARNLNAYATSLDEGDTARSDALEKRLEGRYSDIKEDLQEVVDRSGSKAAQGRFGNYVEAWTTTKISSAFLNSVIVSLATMIVLIPIASMAAYVLTKYKFRGSNALFMLFLGGMMFPQFLVIVPLFLQMSSLGLDDSLFGLTLVYIAFSLPFTVFVLAGFFHQLPDELAEAAMLDGCGHQATFWKIMMPLAKPGLVVVTIFDVIGLWNEYNLALVLMRSQDSYTLPRALDSLQMTAQYLGDTGALMAAMVIVILPVLIVYWLLKEKIHEAMLAGAIKG